MATLVSSISPKDGFHPTSTTIISLPHLKSNCSLHLYFSLPSLVFVDTYELAHHEESYTFRHWGTSNLELPFAAVDPAGSSVLLTVKLPKDAGAVQVDLPLHLRYGDPAWASLGHHSVEVAWPIGFFACPTNPPTELPARNEISIPLPTEVTYLFDPVSFTVSPILHGDNNPSDTVHVPTGNLADLKYVEAGTMLTILLSFFYLLHVSLVTTRRTNHHSRLKVE